MKAAVFRQAGLPLAIETLPDPTPGKGEVLIRVERCGICSSDLHMTEGHGVNAAPNSVLGHEYAGEVMAVGPGVSGLRVGERVTALPLGGCGQCEACLQGEVRWCPQSTMRAGGYAEYVLADAIGCRKLPASISVADGALVEPLAVGLNAVELAQLKPDQRVLVMGAGPIGLATIWWARKQGVGRIAAMASSLRRAELAGIMGADSFIVNDASARDNLREQLGGSPDVVFECVGIPGLLQQALTFTRPRGKVLVASLCVEQDSFMPVVALAKQLCIQYAIYYSTEHFRQAIARLDAGSVEPRAMITDTVSMTDFPATFESLRKSSDQCKVQLAPWMR
jgi:threonine dehydrogenase-like Zn-dependent dehydrogenase